MESKNTIGGRSSRTLSRSDVFDILANPDSNRLVGLVYGVSHSTISKIRRGKVYHDVFLEYKKLSRTEEQAIKETLVTSYAKACYYLDSKFLRISVDDILLSLDLSQGKIVDIEYNAVIRGARIDYMSALFLMQEHGYLCK